jgi:hypothetical protein
MEPAIIAENGGLESYDEIARLRGSGTHLPAAEYATPLADPSAVL